MTTQFRNMMRLISRNRTTSQYLFVTVPQTFDLEEAKEQLDNL